MKVSYRNIETRTDNEKEPISPSFSLGREIIKEKYVDSQLWKEFKNGSDTAYALMYKNNANDLYHYGISIQNNPSFIKDCIHDLFLELWHQRKNLAQVHAIKSYLLKALRNKIHKEYAKGKLLRIAKEGEHHFEIELSVEALTIHYQYAEERRKKIYAALKALTHKQREAIFLKFYHGLSYPEIASILSITTKGAYKLIGRSIHFLRKRMIGIVLITYLIFS